MHVRQSQVRWGHGGRAGWRQGAVRNTGGGVNDKNMANERKNTPTSAGADSSKASKHSNRREREARRRRGGGRARQGEGGKATLLK